MKEEEESSPIWNEGESLHSESPGFSHEQMITCEACLRANPPTRASCLYCAASLPTSEVNATLLKPVLRPLEIWEQGFNAVLLPSVQQLSSESLTEIADLLKLEAEDLERILNGGLALPLARAATQAEALLIQKRVEVLGFEVLIVTDKELETQTPQRLRAMELTEDALIVHLTGGQSEQSVAWADLTLLVAGRRIQRNLVVAERLSRKKEKDIVDSRELSADEPRLDLYAGRGVGAWRVAADNFDFSCLREMKTLVAAQNFQTLTNVLRERAVNAVYDDSYLRARPLLTLVWPLEQRTESLGLRKQGMGGRLNAEAVTKSDNEMQFTRYSKLLHHLRLRQAGTKA